MAEPATKLPVKEDKAYAASAPARAGEWAPFESLRREIDRLFDDFHPFGWSLPSSRLLSGFQASGGPREGWQIAPAMDVAEKDGEYEISAELPGLDENSVEVKVADRMLTIKGEKKEEKEERQKDYHLSERRFGSFQRSFQLPQGVDVGRIEASFAKGVLTVKLPKTAEAKQAERKISAQAR